MLDGLFAHPAWLFNVVSNLNIRNGDKGQNEFFRSLLESVQGSYYDMEDVIGSADSKGGVKACDRRAVVFAFHEHSPILEGEQLHAPQPVETRHHLIARDRAGSAKVKGADSDSGVRLNLGASGRCWFRTLQRAGDAGMKP